MAAPVNRHQARRVFEETLAVTLRRYTPMEDVFLDAVVTDEEGQQVTVARYKVYRDGRYQCFEILDEGLWPNP